MEKTTKKSKAKKKGLKKRIGLIAIGGLSLVLTVCLSVGATLAWFAGSTWSSQTLYMGGPVYVEMSGANNSVTKGEGGTYTDAGTSNWKGGAGSLSMSASTRNTGSNWDYLSQDEKTKIDQAAVRDRVLLPGQKFQIFSQARVYSTAYTNSTEDDKTPNQSTGADVHSTTPGDGTAHVRQNGRITSTTTAVLRARFSINVEFDPSSGFNGFTAEDYRDNYPVQSGLYTGSKGTGWTSVTGETWESALGDGKENDNSVEYWDYEKATLQDGNYTYPGNARRDAVPNTTAEGYVPYTNATTDDSGDLTAIKAGEKKSIYKWKFVSKSVWKKAGTALPSNDGGVDTEYVQMGAPFDGLETTKYSKNGYYGVWVLTKGTDNKYYMQESDSFYKERCNSYMQSYCEQYITEYQNLETREIASGVTNLENALNESFYKLVNDASDAIQAGNLNGGTVTNNVFEYDIILGATGENASWLYIDPKIGNDTNTNELSTSMGGWWYLVASEGGVKAGANVITAVDNSATLPTGVQGENYDTKQVNKEVAAAAVENKITKTGDGDAAKSTFTRKTVKADDPLRLKAKLYEVNPLLTLENQTIIANGTSNVKKIVSYAYPFVNGTAALPGKALTNIFANAKITFQISFQALQAFLPYSATIDGIDYTNALLGTAKVLNIESAIPIYNEAFDFEDTFSVDTLENL